MSSLSYNKKHGSLRRAHSRVKKTDKQFIRFRRNPQVKKSLGLLHIQFLPTNSFHLHFTHWTFKKNPTLVLASYFLSTWESKIGASYIRSLSEGEYLSCSISKLQACWHTGALSTVMPRATFLLSITPVWISLSWVIVKLSSLSASAKTKVWVNLKAMSEMSFSQTAGCRLLWYTRWRAYLWLWFPRHGFQQLVEVGPVALGVPAWFVQQR